MFKRTSADYANAVLMDTRTEFTELQKYCLHTENGLFRFSLLFCRGVFSEF